MFDYQNRWSDDPDASLALAKQYAEAAIEKDPKEPLSHAVAAVAATFRGNLERAQSEIGIALSLNPNLAMAYNIAGSIRMYAGEPLEAIPLIERGIRLDPAGNTQYLHFLGLANLLAGKYETAVALFKERIALVPGTDFVAFSARLGVGHLGEVDEARRIWRELEDINPNYSFNDHLSRLPFKRKEDGERLAEGLRKAGLLN